MSQPCNGNKKVLRHAKKVFDKYPKLKKIQYIINDIFRKCSRSVSV